MDDNNKDCLPIQTDVLKKDISLEYIENPVPRSLNET